MFTPEGRAAEALAAITVPLAKHPMLVGRGIDHDAMRDLLMSLTCPTTCAGVVNDAGGWPHSVCNARVDGALESLQMDPVLAERVAAT
jgi:hypothetical protein